MDTVRNLTSNDVPKDAIKSVETMTRELGSSLVKDYVAGLKRVGETIDSSNINDLAEHVISHAKITMKISIKVDDTILDTLGIKTQPINQSGFNEFEK